MSIARVKLLMALAVVAMIAALSWMGFWVASFSAGHATAGPGSTQPSIPSGLAEGQLGDAAQASDAQRAALADGYVTWAEYESAIWATFNCIRNSGYEPLAEPHPDASGTMLSYSFRVTGDGHAQADASLACQAQNSLNVMVAWAQEQAPSPEQTEAADEAMRACLIDGGTSREEVEAARSFTAFEGRADGGLYPDCLRSVSVEFRIPYFRD